MEETTNELIDPEFGVDLSDVIEQEEGTGNQTGESETEHTEQETTGTTEPAEAEQPTQTTQDGELEKTAKDGEEMFELKYNKDVRKVTREQMTELAQKGLNHDRILQQRDGLQQSLEQQVQWRSQNEGTLNELSEVAKAAGMDVPGFLNAMRVNLLVQNGMSREAAQERVRAERAERQVAENQSRQQRAAAAQSQQEQVRQRQEQDVQNFLRLYSGVDPKTIPQSVWAEVRNGDTLVAAYGRYENQQLRNEIKQLSSRLAAQEQNDKNKQKSLGSVKSSGSKQNTDDFLTGFESV